MTQRQSLLATAILKVEKALVEEEIWLATRLALLPQPGVDLAQFSNIERSIMPATASRNAPKRAMMTLRVRPRSPA